eukprot:snap_masked-scaffold_6-processed-gene-4.52-mRNA-1 protein AED:1.00 eAED:1.00 QI:0/-1/0/0/-1/1/1/0/135
MSYVVSVTEISVNQEAKKSSGYLTDAPPHQGCSRRTILLIFLSISFLSALIGFVVVISSELIFRRQFEKKCDAFDGGNNGDNGDDFVLVQCINEKRYFLCEEPGEIDVESCDNLKCDVDAGAIILPEDDEDDICI